MTPLKLFEYVFGVLIAIVEGFLSILIGILIILAILKIALWISDKINNP